MKVLVRIVLLMMIAAATFGPQPAEATINCEILHVSVTVLNVHHNPVYRLAGAGPNLPTEPVAVPGNQRMTLSWVIYGPGTWQPVLEWAADGVAGWFPSEFNLVVSCSVAGCAASIKIPGTAVVGSLTDNAAVFGLPQPDAMTKTVLTVGKTFWMDGLDTTRAYRRILISCTWAWVETAKTGPNYDTVWNGTPLPGHTVK